MESPHNAGLVKWYNSRFPIFGRGFDSLTPLQHLGNIMKLFEATIRLPDGSEFKDRIGANDAQEARQLLQQRHGPRAVPYIPHMIPS